MTNTEESIENIDQAESYFKLMGCSRFHMMRENPQRNEEYKKLDIDPSIESEWIKEEFEKKISNFHKIETKHIGVFYSSLVSLIERKEFYLEKLVELTQEINNRVNREQLPLILTQIIGNNATKSRGGLIQKSYDLKRPDLAVLYYEQVKSIFEKIELYYFKPTPFIRGYLVDVIEYFGIDADNDFIEKLRLKNYFENFNYYKKEADRRNVNAMKILSEYYREGKGCQKDIVKAEFWELKLKEK
ncbi:hypothetical protein [Algibacter sp. L4_22]|uniref:hypothetical protein n=1 Tax=Algibacter sp. L4_22 TaxID=2942477 RepID=UPI00201B5E50|nr:hypothetical protein [Algibacter sp. L4_22]MCL5130602.1 hypothetical protein [Algibacter sp. L4_22]